MFNLKRYFVLNKLFKYIARTKFVYYKLKYLTILFYNVVISINCYIGIIALYSKIKVIKLLSFISLL